MALWGELCLWCSCQAASWMTDQLFLKWRWVAIRDFEAQQPQADGVVYTHMHAHKCTDVHPRKKKSAEGINTEHVRNKALPHGHRGTLPHTNRSKDTQHLSQEAVGPAWLIKHTHQNMAFSDIVNYSGNNCISAVSKLNGRKLAVAAAGRGGGTLLLCCRSRPSPCHVVTHPAVTHHYLQPATIPQTHRHMHANTTRPLYFVFQSLL